MGTLHFILTGGTIDCYYDHLSDEISPQEQSAIPPFIESMRLYTTCYFTQLFAYKNQILSTAEKGKLARSIDTSTADRIIITHGITHLYDTIQFLEAYRPTYNKTIIFTASTIPLVGIDRTDAGFNLGYAAAQTEHLPAGIYVSLNGRVFTPAESHKALTEGRFDTLFTR